MAEAAPQREGGFGKGFGKGKGRGKGKGKGKGGRGGEEKAWVPVTKLGRLVADGKIKSLEEMYLHGLPIKEHQIIDHFFAAGTLKDEVMKIMSVQKQSSAGQRTRFKAFVAIGDENGHVGLGLKSAKEVAHAIKGAITAAKLSLIPVRRGYWGNKLGEPHTVPMKITGRCGSVRVKLIPAPRGTHIVGAPASKKMITFAGVTDVYTSSTGHTKTKGNFIRATFDALSNTYKFLSPDLWAINALPKSPYQEYSEYLQRGGKKGYKAY